MSEKMGSGTQRRPIPDELGQALQEALGTWRPQTVSLHDAAGDTLWLSAGSIGPDEHALVLSALDVFALEPYREHIHRKLEDGRRALCLAARDPLANCIGVVFAFVERSAVDDARVVTPALQVLLQRFRLLLAPHTDRTTSQSSLTLARDGNLPPGLPELRPIRARKYIRLQSGSGTRRYEVVINPVNAAHDAAVFEHVVDWLVQKRQQYLSKPASFAVPISVAAALDGGFASRVAASLSRNGVDEGLVMLIVPAAAWSAQPEALQPLLDLCDEHRCRVMLDDFELNEAALLLLRSKAIRMLKLSAELTAEAMRERYPRALLSACTHIARVLGIHCIAKRVDTAAAGRWLAVAGVDYLDPFNPAETSAATTTDEAVELQLVS
ncbi:MAG TPA: EAL domain-containing protein [Steroidobacteraceae bacterium]|nr:EAL domain-containing protein [Steroidobacteraceae bacterium]